LPIKQFENVFTCIIVLMFTVMYCIISCILPSRSYVLEPLSSCLYVIHCKWPLAIQWSLIDSVLSLKVRIIINNVFVILFTTDYVIKCVEEICYHNLMLSHRIVICGRSNTQIPAYMYEEHIVWLFNNLS